MHPRLVTTLLLVGMAINLPAQSIPLRQAREAALHGTDTSQVVGLAMWAYGVRLREVDSCGLLADSARRWAEKLDFPKGRARALLALGTYLHEQGQLEKSRVTLEQAEGYALQAGDGVGEGIIVGELGYVHTSMGQYRRALDYFFDAEQRLIPYAEAGQVVATWGLQNVYSAMAQTYQYLSEYGEAVAYAQKALSQVATTQDMHGRATIENDLGDFYRLMGRYEDALAAHDRARTIGQQYGYAETLSWSMIGAGMTNSYRGEMELAELQLTEGLAYATQHDFRHWLIRGNTYLAKIYREQERMEEALACSQQATQKARGYNASLYHDALMELHQVYAAKGAYAEAYATHRSMKAVSDSLATQETGRLVAALHEKNVLAVDKRDLLENTLAQEQKIRSLVVASGVVLLILMVTVFRLYLGKRKDNRMLHDLNQDAQMQNEEMAAQNEEITQQRDQLQLAYEDVEKLAQIGRAITSAQQIEDLMKTIIEEVSKFIDTARLGLGLYREHKDDLFFAYYMEDGKWTRNLKISLKENTSPAVPCFKNQEDIRIGDYEKEYIRYFDTLTLPIIGDHSKSIIYLPITRQDRRLGVLTVQSHMRHAYSDYQMSLLQTLVVYIAIAVENIQAMEELENLSVVARETRNLVVITLPSGKLIWANQAFLDRYEVDSLDYMLQNQRKLMHAFVSRNSLMEAYESLRTTPTPMQLIVQNLGKATEQTTWWQLAATPILGEDGQLKKVVSVAADITELRDVQLELQDKHAQLKVKNQNMTDSIAYAEKIQRSVLRSEDSLRELLPEHFLVNRPRDLISGDFYWVEKHAGKVYLAVADCTGHGVPGALMSVICSHALSENLFAGVGSTGELLDKTRTSVISRLSQSQQPNELTDGMDISLCAFDFEAKTLEWSGAFNPLILINPKREETPAGSKAMVDAPGTFEFRGDRQSIGFSQDMPPFATHRLPLLSGDAVYLFTDGFQDQFGGPQNKKYHAKRLKMKLWELYGKSGAEQQALLTQEFDDWKGTHEQVDDVCLMGVKIV